MSAADRQQSRVTMVVALFLLFVLIDTALCINGADGPCKCQLTTITCRPQSDGRFNLRAFTRCLKNQNGQTTNIQIRNTNLNNLDMITALQPTLFDNLRVLDLRNNRLVSINGTALFQLAPQLQNLSLSGNLLNEFPHFPPGNRLIYLSLSNNQIGSLSSSEFANLLNLRTLDLSNNLIAEIPARLFPLSADGSSLLELNLDYNRLLSPCNITTLNRLQTLRMRANHISQLSRECFTQLPNLHTLDLSDNSIEAIEGLTFKSMSSLTTLMLSNNRITALHDGAFFFQQFDTLERLELDFNQITSVEGKWLYSLGQLKMLNLSNNRISRICDGAWDFTKELVELDLSNNELQLLDTDRFKGLVLLQRLSLSGNQLSAVERDAFQGLQSLYSLDLSHNNLSLGDDPIFAKLNALRELNLTNNSITLLSPAKLTGILDSLRTISLYHNPIRIVALDTFRSLRYLDNLELSSVEFVCDCSLLDFFGWFKQFSASNSSTFSRQVDVTAKCGSPSSLRGLDVFDLTVEELRCDSITRPRLIREPDWDVKAIRFHNLSLECVAQVSDDAQGLQFGWVKDNEPVLNSSNLHVEFSQLADQDEPDLPSSAFATRFVTVRSVLQIREVDYLDAGSYQCVVQAGDAAAFSARSKRITLRVYVAPQLTIKPQSALVRLGDTVKLECAARGDPQATISWNKDGNRDFPAARERRIQFVDQDTTLQIVNVAEADAGVYTCVASNLVGRDNASASLRIQNAPPRFVEPLLRNMAINRSISTVVFNCFVEPSDDNVDVRWFFSRASSESLLEVELVPTAGRYHLVPARGMLIISKVNEQDVGNYSCVANNSAGSRRQTAQLTFASTSRAPLASGTQIGPALGGPRLSTIEDSDQSDEAEFEEVEATAAPSTFPFKVSYEHVLVVVVCSCVIVTSCVWIFLFWLRSRRARSRARKRCQQAVRQLGSQTAPPDTSAEVPEEQRFIPGQTLLTVAEQRPSCRFTPVESVDLLTKRSADSDYASSESHSNGEPSPTSHIFALAYHAAEVEGRNPLGPRPILHYVNRPNTLALTRKQHAQFANPGPPLQDDSPAQPASCFGCGNVSDHLSRSIPLTRRGQPLPASGTLLTLLTHSRSPSVHNGSLPSSTVQSYVHDTPTSSAPTDASQSAQSAYQQSHSLLAQQHKLRLFRASQSYCRIVDALASGTHPPPQFATAASVVAAQDRLVHFAPADDDSRRLRPQLTTQACISQDEQLALMTTSCTPRLPSSSATSALESESLLTNRDSMYDPMIWVTNDAHAQRQKLEDSASVAYAVETNVDS